MRVNDYPQVLQIWQACFGDEESYVRFFWENCFPLCRGLVWEEDGKAVSMLFLLPGALMYKKMTGLVAEYVYAVATLPEYRGRGYAANLVKYAAIIAREEGKSALCLQPAEASLYEYYAKLDFQTAFCKQDFQSVFADGLPICSVGPKPRTFYHDSQFLMSCTCPEGGILPHDIGLQIYHNLRCCAWGNQGYFDWPVHMLEYMHKEHIFVGGEVYADRNVTAFIMMNDGRVKECSLNRPTDEPGGMLLPLDTRAERWLKDTKGKAYLGLTLD